jgi:hypothetical protein
VRLASAKTPEARVVAMSQLARALGRDAGPDLVPFLADPHEAVRERAAVLLGDSQALETLPALLAHFDAERCIAVREGIVRAAGLLGGESEVPWLVAAGREPALRAPACYALARIRSEAALARLSAWKEEALAADPKDESLARLVDYLAGPAFPETERRMGRDVGRRASSASPVPSAPRDGAPGGGR